jgi:hypothetical protein
MNEPGDRILQYADQQLKSLPPAEQQTTVIAVVAELQSWLEAMVAGKIYELHGNEEPLDTA